MGCRSVGGEIDRWVDSLDDVRVSSPTALVLSDHIPQNSDT